jgi:ribosomal protein S12 methylthiotransferase accessory factor
MSIVIGKQLIDGTHRACHPAETLRRIMPHLATMGITRVADVTGLDRLGIPVYQAIRPNSRTLSLSQGKGITPDLAKVSALMESIEMWHAEELALPVTQARLRDMLPLLGYDPFELALRPRHLLHPGTMLEWVPATRLISDEPTFLPKALLHLDFTHRLALAPPLFVASSNGLASGNLLAEAILHGLYETIERDALVHWRVAGWPTTRHLDPTTVQSPTCRALLDRFAAAGVEVLIFDATGPTAIPCFHVAIYSQDLPDLFPGSGCHLDKDVALSRALTEAAQVRLTVVAGARDDLGDPAYLWARGLMNGSLRAVNLIQGARDFGEIPGLSSHDLADDLLEVATRVEAYTGIYPMVVDLTRLDMDIPVAFVVAPGLRVGGAH